jgi:hypothetical protein
MVAGGCKWSFDLKGFFTEQRKFKPSQGKGHQRDVVALDTLQHFVKQARSLWQAK